MATTTNQFEGYSDEQLRDMLLTLSFADRPFMPKMNARRARQAAELQAELAARRDAEVSPSVDRPVTVGGEGACPAGGGAAHRSYRPGGECTFCGEVVA